MTRHIALGNGRLLINIDKWLQIRDIYYPHVGQENHVLGHAHKLGVHVDGQTSWVNEDAWQRNIAYKKQTLVTDCSAENASIGIRLHFESAVHCEKSIFLRKVTVTNNSDHEREVLVYFHHDFHLYGDGIGDTAGYDPIRNSVFHYKRKRYFLMSSQFDFNAGNSRGDIFQYGIGEADGDTKPENDGSLHMNPISQGSVDSIFSVKVPLASGESKTFYYWMLAGESFEDVHGLHSFLTKQNPEVFLRETELCWQGWVNKNKDYKDLPENIIELYKRSLLIIKTQINHNGAIIAANDSDNQQYNKDTYSYMWPRDGALVAMTLQRAGYSDMTKQFYLFCKDVLSEYDCLLHKYNPDGSLGSSWHPWIRDGEFNLPIQEDETALVLAALWHYYEITKDEEFVESLYDSFVKPCAQFLLRYRDEKTGLPLPSYDLWEERYHVTIFGVSSVYSGLSAAAKFAELFDDSEDAENYTKAATSMHLAIHNHMQFEDRFVRGLDVVEGKLKPDMTVDATMLTSVTFKACDCKDASVENTLNSVYSKLATPIGGLARYENDPYFRTDSSAPGNAWFICTLWKAKTIIQRAEKKEALSGALDILKWVSDYSLSTGVLPEQLHPETGSPLSVSPLTWSHAEFVDVVNMYLEKVEELS